MHKTNYRPTRSQQLSILNMIKEMYGYEYETIIVHHVLEDSFLRLYVQIERQNTRTIIFERLEL